MEQREFNLNGRHVDIVGSADNKAKTYLDQPTIRLRRYDGKRQPKEVYGEKQEKKKKTKKKNKAEEFQLANLASLGSLASNNQSPH